VQGQLDLSGSVKVVARFDIELNYEAYRREGVIVKYFDLATGMAIESEPPVLMLPRKPKAVHVERSSIKNSLQHITRPRKALECNMNNQEIILPYKNKVEAMMMQRSWG
jgi:hypothetical protein